MKAERGLNEEKTSFLLARKWDPLRAGRRKVKELTFLWLLLAPSFPLSQMCVKVGNNLVYTTL